MRRSSLAFADLFQQGEILAGDLCPTGLRPISITLYEKATQPVSCKP